MLRGITFQDAAVAAAFSTCILLTSAIPVSNCESDVHEKHAKVVASGQFPVYRMEDVRKNNSTENGGRVWVTVDDSVYDITEFIEMHPGGSERIKLAAGGPVDKFWTVFTQHRTPAVQEILKDYKIGRLHEDDVKAVRDSISSSENEGDYGLEPVRSPALLVHSKRPFNAESPTALLTSSYITPSNLLFVRHHFPIPKLDTETYRVQIFPSENRDNGGLALSLEDLKDDARFRRVQNVSVIQCAGNRRAQMGKSSEGRPARGLAWQLGAIGNVEWEGARLADVLRAAGISEEDVASGRVQHINFKGLDDDPFSNEGYEVSVPADLIFRSDSDAMLAWNMNGEPIPPEHGGPLRVVLPGIVGARQVKWIGQVWGSKDENTSQWQKKDYKTLPQAANEQNPGWDEMPALHDMPVSSGITYPSPSPFDPPPKSNAEPPKPVKLKVTQGTLAKNADGDWILHIDIPVQGWAWSGLGRSIVRVDCTVDGGQTWKVSELTHTPPDDTPSKTKSFGWTLWSATIPYEINLGQEERRENVSLSHRVELASRAMDNSFNVQPSEASQIWNFRGIANNAWHKLPVDLEINILQ